MLSSTLVILTSAVALVAGIAVPRAGKPSNWWSGLENYDTYHARYIDLDCFDQHNTAFFKSCCHPMLKGEKLSDRPAECDPENDCDDSEDDPSSTSSDPAPSPSPSAAAPINVAPNPIAPVPAPHKTTTSHKPKATNKPSSTAALSGTGIATFFFQHNTAGACGIVHQDTDKVVALQTLNYQQGEKGSVSEWCGKTIEITNNDNGNTVTATVADECPTCGDQDDIDLSQAAYDALGAESVGELHVSWKILA